MTYNFLVSILKKKIKKIYSYVSIRKKKTFIFFLIAVFLLNFNSISYKFLYTLTNGLDSSSVRLLGMVNSVINIPYQNESQYKNNHPDIIKFSKEKWFSLPHHSIDLDINFIEDKKNLVDSMPTKEEVYHSESLCASTVYPVKPNKIIFKKLCNHFLTCEMMNIVVPDYVLQEPELLRSIIKIVERPCDYIKTIDEISEEDTIVYRTRYLFTGDYFTTYKNTKKNLQDWIENSRKIFSCDNKDSYFNGLPTRYYHSLYKKKYVLIIIDKTGIFTGDKDTIDILVERKDI